MLHGMVYFWYRLSNGKGMFAFASSCILVENPREVLCHTNQKKLYLEDTLITANKLYGCGT